MEKQVFSVCGDSLEFNSLFSSHFSPDPMSLSTTSSPAQFPMRISIIKENRIAVDLSIWTRVTTMAIREFKTAALLFAAATYGDYAHGELETSNGDVSASSGSRTSAAANMNIAGDVLSQADKAKFVGLNICGFDFGWSVTIKLLIIAKGETCLLTRLTKQQSKGLLRPK